MVFLYPDRRERGKLFIKLDVQHFWLEAIDIVYIASASPEGAQ